jgi:uncharacterized protein
MSDSNPYHPSKLEPVEPSFEGITEEQKTWGMLAHLLSLSGFLVPLGSVIAPLVVWLIKKDTMPFVEDQGKESLNFQISMLIVSLIVGVVAVITSCIAIGIVIGLLGGLGLMIVELIFVIQAGMAANKGIAYRYPYTWRFIK